MPPRKTARKRFDKPVPPPGPKGNQWKKGKPSPGSGPTTKYDPAYVDQVANACVVGATDREIADMFGVCLETIYKWRLMYPAFARAMTVGKEVADQRVETSMFRLCVGDEKNPPNFNAARFWLTNRKPKDWKDVKFIGPTDQKVVQHDRPPEDIRNEILGDMYKMGLIPEEAIRLIPGADGVFRTEDDAAQGVVPPKRKE